MITVNIQAKGEGEGEEEEEGGGGREGGAVMTGRVVVGVGVPTIGLVVGGSVVVVMIGGEGA